MQWIDLSLPMDDADFFIYMVPFPAGKIHGSIRPNDDGTFSVYIDVNASSNVQQKAYWHEYKHIAYDDFYNNKPIEEIEEF